MKKVRQIVCFLLCIVFIFNASLYVQASESTEQRTVRVGFFSSDGYHIMDEDGTKRGYGYDFLQMMLRYNDWQYEYIGYDKNWGDMLGMLERGEIDMVTLANKTPERMEKFDFSEKSIGTSSTIMSIAGDNTTITAGQYESYNGAVVGLVKGSSHNEKFEEYAAEKGFSYSVRYYEDIEDLLLDLRNRENIDIAVTSNMRQIHSEIILDEFNATEYYAIVKKGNEDLLNEINSGIAQLNVYSPDWRTSLFQKYYSDIHTEVISLSAEEREYLADLVESGTVVTAVMNPELEPYSYFENGEAKGVVPVIFAEVARRVGLQYEIIEAEDRWEYKELLNSGEADIDLTAYLDYSLAQIYNLKETDAYINSMLAMLTTKDSNTDKETMVVAAVREPTEYMGYNNDLIYQYNYKEYESVQDCIRAVKTGEADATFQYVYIAEQAVMKDYTNRLQYTILQDYTFGLAIGVSCDKDHRLLSILNKGVNSLTSAYTQSVILEETTRNAKNHALISLVYDHPWFVILIVGFILSILFMMVLLLVINKAQRNRLIASREMERFIGYVCESYELVMEINLKSRQRIVYKMVGSTLSEEVEAHTLFDRAYFEPIVQEEDLERMIESFSDETIDRMIAEGGTQEYLECQVKNASGDYNWYSYIIKAVAKDEQNPRNFIVFKKDIHSSKMEEEEQKQILRDALENARSASMAKGHFLSRMSHEIRTPLNAIIGYMQIAQGAGGNLSKLHHCMKNSNLAAKHLLNIINDVLDISSIESGKMKIAHEEFDLKSQITSLSAMFFNQAKEKNVKFEVTLNNIYQEWVVGDSLRVNQVLLNLLSNAVKFTPEGGRITLEVTQIDTDDKKVFMKFSIHDTGIGMSEEYQKRLFQPFEQESAVTAQKYGGTGLGLSITYNLIQMMGGSIDVTSRQNEGSTFVVSLHFDRGSTEHETVQGQQDYSKVRVLIVEDDEAACDYMKNLLKRCKVKCDVVKTAEAAEKQMLRRMDSDYEYHMCIIDWNMQNLEGIWAAKAIKEMEMYSRPLMIAMTYDVSECEEEARKAGIDKIIAKPLFQSTMFDLLVTSFGKYEPMKEEGKNLEDIKGMRVLLAEDNAMNLEIATEILRKAGLIVETASDGKEASERFLEKPEGSYDVILMDVQMPIMDGYQTTGVIRKSHHPEAKTIPIVAMTANAFAEDVNAALASGMNGHIAKPVDYDKLYEVLSRFCKNKK